MTGILYSKNYAALRKAADAIDSFLATEGAGEQPLDFIVAYCRQLPEVVAAVDWLKVVGWPELAQRRWVGGIISNAITKYIDNSA